MAIAMYPEIKINKFTLISIRFHTFYYPFLQNRNKLKVLKIIRIAKNACIQYGSIPKKTRNKSLQSSLRNYLNRRGLIKLVFG